MRPSPRTILLGLVAAPLLAALGVAAAMSIGGALPFGPLAPDSRRNLAEAIMLSDAATAAWLLEMGADPNALYDLRPDLVDPEVGPRVRPLAAAVYTSDDVVIRVAQRYGARLSPEEAHAVACRMAGKGREAIGRLVAPAGWTADSCRAAEARR